MLPAVLLLSGVHLILVATSRSAGTAALPIDFILACSFAEHVASGGGGSGVRRLRGPDRRSFSRSTISP